MKTCLITLARNEEEHIEEFINHYLNIIKVDHIFWIDNNRPPHKPIEIDNKHVSVIHMNDIDFGDGVVDPIVHQTMCINNVISTHAYPQYDWCMYFDVDELLDLNGQTCVEYLSKLPNDVEFVAVQWAIHGNNYYVFDNELPYKTMKENFGWNEGYKIKKEFKPIFKVKENVSLNMYCTYPEDKVPHLVKGIYKPLIDENIKVHHYRIQTIEHYLRHKVLNGFYGLKHKSNFVMGIFNSPQFKTSNVKLHRESYDDIMKLLEKYNITLSKSDMDYLKIKFNK